MDVVISLRGVQISIHHNIILQDVDVEIRKGEFVYLIGKTGSGKSSLLRTLYGDLELDNGEGYVAGFDLVNIKRGKVPFLRRKLGIVFQDFQLLTDRTVVDNLMFVMKATGWKDKKKMEERALHVLAKVGLENKGYKFPHQLSGGEQQRVAIARALLNDPDIILADEPTGNLDPETSRNILELLTEIAKNGRAVLMATHDHETIKKFDSRIIKCENGRLVELLSIEQHK